MENIETRLTKMELGMAKLLKLAEKFIELQKENEVAIKSRDMVINDLKKMNGIPIVMKERNAEEIIKDYQLKLESDNDSAIAYSDGFSDVVNMNHKSNLKKQLKRGIDFDDEGNIVGMYY
jgi:flagellar hook protein FlgE